MFRRALAVSLAVLASATMTTSAGSTSNEAGDSGLGRFDRPRQGFAPPGTVLRPGAPEHVGLDDEPLENAARRIHEWTQPAPDTGHPRFSGAVTLLAHHGVVVDRRAFGKAVRYADADGTELPQGKQVPMREDTIFDIASLSKLFTSIAVLQLVDDGDVRIDAPVARYLPAFAANGKQDIMVEQLLTHTSGLEPFLPLWRDYPDKESRIRAVLDVEPRTEPGSEYIYSDLNLITLGVLVERVSGSTLDEFVRRGITEPLGMTDTGYNPPASKLDRIAATEYQSTPARGMVRGEVHDENAWSLGGVAGHAGVFSTARDLAVLGQAIMNGGVYDGARILRRATVRRMLTDRNGEYPGHAHGLGFELNQRWYMGGLTGPRTAGHTGFTGTSLVLDPASRSIAVLLTNRVHPTREWGSINAARETLATGMAGALAVPPRRGPTAWHTAIGDGTTATLRTRTLRPSGSMTVRADAFVDSEHTDELILQASSDGRNWRDVPVTVAGRGSPDGEVHALAGSGHRSWWHVSATLGSQPVALRWQFTTDQRYTGRGIYLDNVQVTDASGTLLDGERHPEEFIPEGWQLADR